MISQVHHIPYEINTIINYDILIFYKVTDSSKTEGTCN